MKHIYGRLCRVYGNEKTHLRLTEKAEQFYNDCDPLTIYERDEDIEDENGDIIDTDYRYTITGITETVNFDGSRKWLTGDDVNALLEEEADEFARLEGEEQTW